MIFSGCPSNLSLILNLDLSAFNAFNVHFLQYKFYCYFLYSFATFGPYTLNWEVVRDMLQSTSFNEELFTWSLKPIHIYLSWFFFHLQTKQNTEILFGWKQIDIAKYRFQEKFLGKGRGLEQKLFPEGTCRFQRI